MKPPHKRPVRTRKPRSRAGAGSAPSASPEVPTHAASRIPLLHTRKIYTTSAKSFPHTSISEGPSSGIQGKTFLPKGSLKPRSLH